MVKLLLLLTMLFTVSAHAYQCDCEIRVFAPITASQNLGQTSLKTYELESFDTLSKNSQNLCRKNCEEKFQSDMTEERMNALLAIYSQKLIEEKVAGFNCTGLATFKYPVRVKASLGNIGLGNVFDQMYVVTHEEECF